ncbi:MULTISPECIES: hypothetical protein [Sorangium]|uniref:Tetratricopeptide repeat protein n=1 Tax=Sorangium cellulosum TaxID=56 RepID=A0A4P2QT39_SORCE|nr:MULTISPECIES: hypothetical protein [Sorangium]AUX33469.1 hypothetical protein SOCE836_056290 [Sorangium cellulosum]WCQ92785.1 hypothetical protein NQZ70_05531 [Sorangium sp. Soce836]
MSLTSPLRAQPTAADKALAEGLFQDGKKLMDEGRLTEACPKLAESQRVDPTVGTLLNLAVCHEKEGKTASAWAEFKEASALAATAGQQDRSQFAARRAAELEARLTRLVLEVAEAAPGMSITLNGKELSAAAATGSGIPVDPGTATIEANAPGKQPWSQQVTLDPGPSAPRVVIPPLADAAAQRPAQAAPAAPPAPAVRPGAARPEATGSPVRTLGFVAGGVGLAGLGVGAVFGIMAIQKAGDVEAGCGGNFGCSRADVEANESARTTAMVSNIAVGAGLLCLGAGAAMVLLSRSPEEPVAGERVWLSPTVASDGGRVTLGGRW